MRFEVSGGVARSSIRGMKDVEGSVGGIRHCTLVCSTARTWRSSCDRLLAEIWRANEVRTGRPSVVMSVASRCSASEFEKSVTTIAMKRICLWYPLLPNSIKYSLLFLPIKLGLGD